MLNMYYTDKYHYKPIDKKTNYVKRCVGIAGDTLEIKEGYVYINGKKNELSDRAELQFSYLVQPKNRTFKSKDYKTLVSEIKDYRAGLASDARQASRAVKMNADIKKLYDDKVIQNLITGDLDNKAKKQILNRAVNLLGDDISVASKRLFMMAQSIAGTSPIEGIKGEETYGKKIIIIL